MPQFYHWQQTLPAIDADLSYLAPPGGRVPGMQAHEALLIKCWDSATDGRARLAPHTAFEAPNPPSDAPPRERIEVRALLFG